MCGNVFPSRLYNLSYRRSYIINNISVYHEKYNMIVQVWFDKVAVYIDLEDMLLSVGTNRLFKYMS